MDSRSVSTQQTQLTSLLRAHDQAKVIAWQAVWSALRSVHCWRSQLIQLTLIVAAVFAAYRSMKFAADRWTLFDANGSSQFSILMTCISVGIWMLITRCPLVFLEVWRAAYWTHINNAVRDL